MYIELMAVTTDKTVRELLNVLNAAGIPDHRCRFIFQSNVTVIRGWKA